VLYHPSGIALADGDNSYAASAAEDAAAPQKGVKQYRLFAKIANMWRTYKDMQPVWTEVQAIIDYWAADDPETHPQMYATEFEDFLSASQPGAVQDPDALLVGNEDNQPSCHPCLARTPPEGFCPARNGADPNLPCLCCGTLSLVEEQTNMVMWAMFAAPLEIAADVRRIPNASAAILLNREVIAVNQASRCRCRCRCLLTYAPACLLTCVPACLPAVAGVRSLTSLSCANNTNANRHRHRDLSVFRIRWSGKVGASRMTAASTSGGRTLWTAQSRSPCTTRATRPAARWSLCLRVWGSRVSTVWRYGISSTTGRWECTRARWWSHRCLRTGWPCTT
jgi:hypothetical protein